MFSKRIIFIFTFIITSQLCMAQTPESDPPTMCLLFAALFILICVITVFIFWIRKIKNSREKNGHSLFEVGDIQRLKYDTDIKKQAHLLPYDNQWEFPICNLKLGDCLGSGTFVSIYKAEAKGIIQKNINTTVVVHRVKENNAFSRNLLSTDLKIMIHLGRHLNLVNLVGVCRETRITKELKILVEYCCFGNMRQYLQNHKNCFVNQVATDGYLDYDIRSRHDSNICHHENVTLESTCTYDLICWAWQVVNGMEYLSSRNIKHENLALRNILLAENNVVKIKNFGISKTIDFIEHHLNENSNKVKLSKKWMAIESLRDNIFSIQSDIWAFGVVLWEMFSLADTPYLNIPEQLLENKLIKGHRMTKPKYANTQIYHLMLDCWRSEPMKRPSFLELSKCLGLLLTDQTISKYTNLNEKYMRHNPKTSVLTDYISAPTYLHEFNKQNNNM